MNELRAGLEGADLFIFLSESVNSCVNGAFKGKRVFRSGYMPPNNANRLRGILLHHL